MRPLLTIHANTHPLNSYDDNAMYDELCFPLMILMEGVLGYSWKYTKREKESWSKLASK
jgi:hypothetical protein